MNHIDGFFSKFKSAFANMANKKEIVAAVCLAHSKTTIPLSGIEIQGPVLRLNISPAAKSAIFMKKTEILAELNQKIKPALFDIR